jgi:phage shock protein PspC (stress-responsive transcriptional regulator)
MIQSVLDYFERKAYGVCSWLAFHMGIKTHNVRLSFIYLSFLTFGSPIFVYLVLMFWKRHNYIFKPTHRRRIFE